jgi:predicted nucleic acid-binding protein
VNHKKLTFIDAGVLIAASRGDSEQSKKAISVLDDPSREFISSLFVKLEVLPKAVYNKKKHEAEFYNAFFDSVSLWADDLDLIVKMANQKASEMGLAAMDSLHLAAAISAGAEDLVTTERPSKPIFRTKDIQVVSIQI